MWQTRRWRELLNLIDHLPRNSYYSQAVSLDDEHARMLAAAREASGEDPESYAPPMSMWTMESDLLATLVDEVRGLKHITMAVNAPKGKRPNPPKTFPRPRTAMARARVENRAARHRALAARVLPHKYGGAKNPDPDTLSANDGQAAPSQGAPQQSAPVTKSPSPLDMPTKKGTWAV